MRLEARTCDPFFFIFLFNLLPSVHLTAICERELIDNTWQSRRVVHTCFNDVKSASPFIHLHVHVLRMAKPLYCQGLNHFKSTLHMLLCDIFKI